MSLLGALTPLVQVARMRRTWAASVGVYSISGLVSAGFVGFGLGWLGHLIVRGDFQRSALMATCAVGLLAIARDAGWLRTPWPHPIRQTDGWWGDRFPGLLTPAMWGLDVGMAFATRFTFSGTPFLGALAIANRSPEFGAELLMCFWLGRAASVWLAPAWVRSGEAIPEFLRRILEQRDVLRRVHIGTLCSAIAILLGAVALK